MCLSGGRRSGVEVESGKILFPPGRWAAIRRDSCVFLQPPDRPCSGSVSQQQQLRPHEQSFHRLRYKSLSFHMDHSLTSGKLLSMSHRQLSYGSTWQIILPAYPLRSALEYINYWIINLETNMQINVHKTSHLGVLVRTR